MRLFAMYFTEFFADYKVQNAISLSLVVQDLTASERKTIVEELDDVTVKFARLRFPRIGALSVATDAEGKHTFSVYERPLSMFLDDDVLDGAEISGALPLGKASILASLLHFKLIVLDGASRRLSTMQMITSML